MDEDGWINRSPPRSAAAAAAKRCCSLIVMEHLEKTLNDAHNGGHLTLQGVGSLKYSAVCISRRTVGLERCEGFVAQHLAHMVHGINSRTDPSATRQYLPV